MNNFSQKDLKNIQEALKFAQKVKEIGIFNSPTINEISEKTNSSLKHVTKMINYFNKYKLATIEIVLNYQKFNSLCFLVMIKSSHPKYNQEIWEKLKKLRFVQNVVLLSGEEATHLVKIRAPGLNHLYKWLTDELKKFGSEIDWTRTMLVYHYFLEEAHRYNPEKEMIYELLDKIDFKILCYLKEDGLMTLGQLAKKINLREPTIYRRIKILKEKKVILGYRIRRKWNNIPKEFWPIISICNIRTKPNESMVFGKSLSNEIWKYATYIYEVLGAFDTVCCIRAKSIGSLKHFINDQLSKKEGLLETKVYFVLDWYHRDEWIWEVYEALKDKNVNWVNIKYIKSPVFG